EPKKHRQVERNRKAIILQPVWRRRRARQQIVVEDEAERVIGRVLKAREPQGGFGIRLRQRRLQNFLAQRDRPVDQTVERRRDRLEIKFAIEIERFLRTPIEQLI